MTETPPPIVEDGLRAAQARSTQARQHLAASLSRVRDHLTPASLGRRMVRAATAKGVDAGHALVEEVRERPLATAGIAAGIAALAGLFFARKPIARALSDDEAETARPSARSSANRPAAPYRTGSSRSRKAKS